MNILGSLLFRLELREDGTEVDAFIKPQTAFADSMRCKGDLHMHSTWSDGAYSIEEMAEACRARAL